jgi:predicted glycoside hydrolase/deacetylase ChbG (UPF0249 family)
VTDRVRALIVNADDFGQSEGINRGVIEGYARGVVTSASLMVCWPASQSAAAHARTSPSLSVGLHIDLGEWIFENLTWRKLYDRIDSTDPLAVEREVRFQIERCRDLLGKNPTHLDSHQHVHRNEPVRSIVLRLAGELGVPLRHCSPAIRYCGDFYGQTSKGESLPNGIGISALTALLRQLPEGVTEMACHPGYADDLISMYRVERSTELRTLCAAKIRQVLDEEQIALISFSNLKEDGHFINNSAHERLER